MSLCARLAGLSTPKITHYVCRGHERLTLVGSLPEFGIWNPFKGILANQHPEGTWEVAVSINADQDLEFKWVIICGDAVVRWEERPNRYIKTPDKDTVYTSMWNEEMEIKELVCKGGTLSSLRKHKQDLSTIGQHCLPDQEKTELKEEEKDEEIQGSIEEISSNLCKELESVKKISSALKQLTEHKTKETKKYSIINSRISSFIVLCVFVVFVACFWHLADLEAVFRLGYINITQETGM